ncbi:MAG: NDP-sugar synthase [Elusimicrobiota bacterium]
MQAIILTGGLGTRLRPFTCGTPKPLLPVVNTPFIHYQLNNLRRHGITEVILATAYRPEQFKRILGTGSKLGVRIRYVHEKKPLGTGGAVLNAGRYLNGTTLILNGDVLHALNIPAFIRSHRKAKAEISLTLVSVGDPTRFGLVETGKDGRITRFLEKPSWEEVTCDTINAGAYLFEPSAIESIPGNRPASLERDLFPQALEQGRRIFAYTSREYWIDFGTVDKYLQIHLDILGGHAPFLPKRLKRQGDFLLDAGAKVSANVVRTGAGCVVLGRSSKAAARSRFIGSVCVGDRCVIEEDAVLEDCVVLSGTRIAAGARITRAIVGGNCRIGRKTVLGPGRTLGDRSIVCDYSTL